MSVVFVGAAEAGVCDFDEDLVFREGALVGGALYDVSFFRTFVDGEIDLLAGGRHGIKTHC